MSLSCRNCGAVLTGPFCAACGQQRGPPDSLAALAVEWRRQVFGSEAILWDTLVRLALRPGDLTRDWWEGRRSGVMSPVRTVLTVLLVGAGVSVVHRLLFPSAGADLSKLLGAFTYQLIAVGVCFSLSLLPRLLPAEGRPTDYQIATFALYEAAFLGLLLAALALGLLLASAVPLLAVPWLGWLAPAVAPALVMVALGHPILHLRQAFRMSWIGAVLRTAALAPPVAIGMLALSILFAATGIDRFWAPHVDQGELGHFHRVAQP